MIGKLHMHDTDEVSQLFDSSEIEGFSEHRPVVCVVPNLLTSPTSLFSFTNYDVTTSYVFSARSSRRRLTSMTLLVAELDIRMKRLKWTEVLIYSWWEPSIATCFVQSTTLESRRISNGFSVCPVVQKGNPS